MELASKGQLRAAFLRRAIVIVPSIVLLGFIAARLVPVGDANCWYVQLDKPALNPPDWAFPVVWGTLYVLIGVALALVVAARGAPLRGVAIGLFLFQLALNLSWTPVFFGAHRIGAATAMVAVMLAIAIAATMVFGRIRPLAAWLMVPYLAWLGFVGALTWQIGQLNPGAERLACRPASAQIAL